MVAVAGSRATLTGPQGHWTAQVSVGLTGQPWKLHGSAEEMRLTAPSTGMPARVGPVRRPGPLLHRAVACLLSCHPGALAVPQPCTCNM